jgi:hypothetical protein
LVIAAEYRLRATMRFPVADERGSTVVGEVPPGRRALDRIPGRSGTPSIMIESLIFSRSRFLGSHVKYVANTLGRRPTPLLPSPKKE